jgi:hypothetical protein
VLDTYKYVIKYKEMHRNSKLQIQVCSYFRRKRGIMMAAARIAQIVSIILKILIS